MIVSPFRTRRELRRLQEAVRHSSQATRAIVKLLDQTKAERGASAQHTSRTLDSLRVQVSANSRALQRFEEEQKVLSSSVAISFKSLSEQLAQAIHDKAETDSVHLNHVRSIAAYVDSIREQLEVRSKTDQALRKQLGRSLADVAGVVHELEITGQLPYNGKDVRGVERLRSLARDLDGVPNTSSGAKVGPEEPRMSPCLDNTYTASCH
ncbi:uncharacterized protein EI90DRAFT_3285466 [Cantharellus anzutake]|uniref:uncharacterized protein n=1 Tax=Cantharellus anzutake TaxID=1750568 RepID=UPI00190818D1|nr:uncharacterized protein EI90DRAFT_3285466 [Cantharellus anzutake]KAF8341278.1 hypothetical protein EI90DRAFT_3285466 [Cantharellus anzutake]